MIVDSSAVVAIVRKESDALVLGAAIDRAETPRLSAATYVEVAIVIDSRRRPSVGRDLDTFLKESRIVIEPVTEAQARIAREAYRDYGRGSGHPARLNFGDCFAYALARDRMEPLLCKGDDFGHTDVRSALT